MKPTKIRIVINTIWTVARGFERELEVLEGGRRAETIKSTALSRMFRIRRIWETGWNLLLLRRQWKIISKHSPGSRWSKNRRKRKDRQVFGPCQRTWRWRWYPTCNWCACNNPKMLGKQLGVLKIGGLAETIKTTSLLRSTRILRKVLEI